MINMISYSIMQGTKAQFSGMSSHVSQHLLQTSRSGLSTKICKVCKDKESLFSL